MVQEGLGCRQRSGGIYVNKWGKNEESTLQKTGYTPGPPIKL